MGTIIGIIVALLVSGLIIWIVGKLGLGLTVSGFGAAFIAAAVIAIVSGVIAWLLGLVGLTLGAGLVGGIVTLIVSAIVLLISGSFVPGMQVKGFIGAIVAAVAIAIVSWIVYWLLSLVGLG
jgi:putative membrane protein